MNDVESSELSQLVNQFEVGDEQAKNQLFELTYTRLQKLASKMLKNFPTVRRWEDTDDIYQRAAIRLAGALDEVKPTSSRHFFNLAAMQVRRELIDLSRRFENRNVSSNQRPTEASSTLDQGQTSPATETHEAFNLAAWTEFHESVERLDEEYRETFQLIWYQGLSQEFVAELTEVSQHTVSRRWQKARREIFRLLGRQLPG